MNRWVHFLSSFILPLDRASACAARFPRMLYRVAPAAASPARVLRLQPAIYAAAFLAALVVCAAPPARAQGFAREVDAPGKLELRVKNRTGRVTVEASDEQKTFSVSAASAAGLSITERDVRVYSGAGGVEVVVEREHAGVRPADGRKVNISPAQVERERIDLVVRVPARTLVPVETEAGAVDILGNVSDASVKTDTGTIRADVPLDALHYSFRWTLSR